MNMAPREPALSAGSKPVTPGKRPSRAATAKDSKEDDITNEACPTSWRASTESASLTSASPPQSSASSPPPRASAEEMAASSVRRPRTPRREIDLSSLLNPEQKDDTILLVNRILDAMQRRLCKVFDYTDADAKAASLRTPWHIPFPSSLKDNSLNLGRRENQTTSPEGGLGKETHEPRLVELKKESLLVFRKWQAMVQKRLAEITVKNNAMKPGQSYAAVASTSKASSTSRSRGCSGDTQRKGPATTLAQADAALIQLFPPISTHLTNLPPDKRAMLLHAMLLLVLSLESYGPNSRILMLHLASSLHVGSHVLAVDEARLAGGLFRLVKDVPAEELVRKKGDDGRHTRRGRSGAGGGASSGPGPSPQSLPMPLIDAGVGTTASGAGLAHPVAASLLGPVVDSNIPIGALFGIYGTRTTERIMEQCIREIENFAFLPVHGANRTEYRDANDIAPDDRKLRVTLCINGWLGHEAEAVTPWQALGNHTEVFALGWEVEVLQKMRSSLDTILSSATWASAKQEIRTWASEERNRSLSSHKFSKSGPVIAALHKGNWPAGLMKLSKIIDNPWSICMVRADKAGVLLADVIINKVQGERGVTLIGYSMGARVIYTCLMTLAERRQFGLVESAVLMGVPAPSQSRIWSIMRSVVAGRMVNVYSENDYLLGFLYRTGSIQYGVAGLQAIDGGFGVENLDVSDMISSHRRYQYLASTILKHLSWEDININQVAQDVRVLAAAEETTKHFPQQKSGNQLENRALDKPKLAA